MHACIVDGCEKPARSNGPTMCPMHYHRQYRHGSTDKVSTTSGLTASHGRRYRRIAARNHPLVDKSGRVYEHRMVLYDLIGPGVHACHWCEAAVEWLPKGEPGALVVDHINGYGDDNRPENLVPSCYSCNTTRGLQARSDVLRAAGWWSNNDTIASLKGYSRRDPINTPLAS